jgi:hypothetical protein
MRLETILAGVCVTALCGCGGQISDGDELGQVGEALSHTSDLASHMPAHLAIMDVMAWFGIPSSMGGPDNSFGNWDVTHFNCVQDRSPTSCDASGNRAVASRYHPLAGMYSSTGRDAEGLARIKLMLSNLRSSCNLGARLDAFAIQQGGLHFSSLHGSTSGGAPEIAYQALTHWLAEADAEGRTGAVVPMDDITWYWNNGHWLGLDCAASRSTCIKYVQDDVIDLVRIASPHPSALRINGKLLLYFYLDTASAFPSMAEWNTILANARAATGQDFYTVATHAPASAFAAFDGVSPWVDPGYAWPHTAGGTVYAHAQRYAAFQHDPLYAALPAGKVVFGGVAPGFDDFTMHWGGCDQRQIPTAAEGTPRHLDVLRGSIDYLRGKGAHGVIVHTWDDWTEGSFMEPSVEEGTSKIVTLRQKLGDLYGEAQNAAGDQQLSDRWVAYGKTYPCSGGVGSYNAPAACSSAPVQPPPPPVTTTCAPAVVLEPTQGESVGPSIHLRVSGGGCLTSMIAYIDGVEVERSTLSPPSIDQWVGVALGARRLHVNAWEPNGTIHQTPDVAFTRTY